MKSSDVSPFIYPLTKQLVTKQNDYQVSSGAKITCAKFGAQNYQLLAAGDDQKNINLWKLSKNLPKLVRSLMIKNSKGNKCPPVPGE